MSHVGRCYSAVLYLDDENSSFDGLLFCLQADKVKFQLRLGQSKPIYNAFKAIQESSDWQTLSDARRRIVESKLLCYLIDMLFL